jgi:hypothetical protein
MSCSMEGLMEHGPDHASDKIVRIFAKRRHKKTRYSWHTIPPGRRYWSRREELNAPSAEYFSAALALSYTGETRLIYGLAPAESSALFMCLRPLIPRGALEKNP